MTLAESDLEPLAVSPETAGRLLDVSRQTVYNLLNSGQLFSLKVGSRRLIPMTALRAFLEQGGVP